MKKRTPSSSSFDGGKDAPLKKPPPQDDNEEEQDDRKPAARMTNDDSQAPTDQSIGSNASNSTVACTPLTLYPPTTKGGGHHHEPLHLATIDEHGTGVVPPITTQVALLGGTSALSFMAFIVLMLPAEALLALSLAIMAFSLLIFQVYRFAQHAYRDAVNGRGIGDYLPRWLFSMLVEDSIHEQMTDDSFNLEWRHMALYMIPGLSRAQIDAFVDRLPRRHRDFLLRPGAGHVLGDEFMQLILGRERYPEVPRPDTAQIMEQPEGAALLPPPMPNNPRRLNFVPNMTDDDSSTVLSDHDSPSLVDRSTERTPSRTLSLPRQGAPPPVVATPVAHEEEDENQNDYEREFAVLVEAAILGFNSMVLTPALSITWNTMNSMTDALTSPGVSMTLVSGSMGIYSFWRGLWGRQGVRAQLSWRDRDVWATAVLGGGVAGVLLFARANRRSARKKSGKK